MHRCLIAVLLLVGCEGASAASLCPQTAGTMVLRASSPRTSIAAPALFWLDLTATTDSAISSPSSVYENIWYEVNFSDTGLSGKGVWTNGAPGSGYKSKNVATGFISAHVYTSPGTYPVVIRGTNPSGSIAVCKTNLTVVDPATQWPGTATTCASSSGVPVAGVGGCPAGAGVVLQNSFNAVITTYFGSNKRVLFKCGDTFTGTGVTLTGTVWSVGAYGGCEGTKVSRPILTNATGADHITVAKTSGDGRIADLVFQGNGNPNTAVIGASDLVRIPYQITLVNLASNNNKGTYAWSQGAQWGVVDSTATQAIGQIGAHINFNENNPASWAGNPFNNLDYQAFIGNQIQGVGCCGTGSGIETLRLEAGRLWVINNNTLTDANNVGAVLKVHNGNTSGTLPTWTGVYTELWSISDNQICGNYGAVLSDVAPQNGSLDERLRYGLIERNHYCGPGNNDGGRQLLVTGQNFRISDNVFDFATQVAGTKNLLFGIQATARGAGNTYVTQFLKVLNNTFRSDLSRGGQAAIGFDSVTQANPAAANSSAINNLFSAPTNETTVDNAGSGNTVSNNTSNSSLSPGFVNASGSLATMPDYKPTQNAGGGTSTVVRSDALGVGWAAIWNLGAIKLATTP